DGVDLSPEMVDQARAKGIFDALSVEEATAALTAPQRAGQYDLVLCNFCLFYFIDLKGFFKGSANCLGPGGRLILTVYPCWDDCDVMRKGPPLEYAHSRKYLRRMAAESGLVEERID